MNSEDYAKIKNKIDIEPSFIICVSVLGLFSDAVWNHAAEHVRTSLLSEVEHKVWLAVASSTKPHIEAYLDFFFDAWI